MKQFLVYHTSVTNPDSDQEEVFSCQAEDIDHANKQCLEAYPDTVVLGFVITPIKEYFHESNSIRSK